jgi:hypothetical protein
VEVEAVPLRKFYYLEYYFQIPYLYLLEQVVLVVTRELLVLLGQLVS